MSRPVVELLVTLSTLLTVVLCQSRNCSDGSGLPVVKKTISNWSADCSSSVNCNSSDASDKTPLYFVVMAPYPDCPPYNPRWEGGPAVVPSAIVAKDLINNRDDILKDYRIELIVSDSGCNISCKAVASFLYNLFYSGRNVVGIIGPGCSEAALVVARLVSDSSMSLIQIAPSATSPSLTDTSLYPNTFRPIASALGFIDMHLNLIKQKNYRHIGAVYEGRRVFQLTVYGEFEKAVKNSFGGRVELTPFSLFDGHFPLYEFRSKIRIIFVFACTDIARQLLCSAYNENLLYPDYLFIFIDTKPSDFIANVSPFPSNGKIISCDKIEMMKVIRGMVFTNFRLTRTDRDATITDAGISYREFNEIYEKARKHHLQSLKLEESINTPHYSNYFDATWALALSLNNSLPHLEERGLSLSNYSYQVPEITKIVKKEVLNLNFEGMRGRVQFSKDKHDNAHFTIIDIYQVLGESNNYGPIGYLDLLQGPDIVFFGNASKSFISDHFDRRPHYAFGVIITVVVTILFVALIFCQLANVVWGNHKNIKATSPNLNHLIFSGCYLSLVGVITYTSVFVFIDVPVTMESNLLVPVHCSALQWSCTMMYSLVFGTLCAKRWRIHRIFNSFRATPIKCISDNILLPMALFPLVIDVIVNIAWNSIDPWKFNADQGNHLSVCQTRNEIAWSICVAVPKVVLTVVVLYFAIATRRVHKKEFKQTKSINILIYSLVILTGIFLPNFFILQPTASVDASSNWSATVSYLIFCMFDIGFVVLCIILVLLPPLMPSIKAKLPKRRRIEAQRLISPILPTPKI